MINAILLTMVILLTVLILYTSVIMIFKTIEELGWALDSRGYNTKFVKLANRRIYIIILYILTFTPLLPIVWFYVLRPWDAKWLFKEFDPY